MTKLNYETISPSMHEVLLKMMDIPELSSFRLVGGTALSLQLGHRESIDIDLFTDKNIDFTLISIQIKDIFSKPRLLSVSANGQTWNVEGVKVDIYDWHVPFLQDPLIVDNIRMASIEEIATYKFEALTGRRSEKDFIDIAEILKHKAFKDLLKVFRQRYPFIQTGAFMPYLLSPHLFERDETIIRHTLETFDLAAERIQVAIQNFEKEEVEATQQKNNDRDARLAELLKRKKK